MKIYSVLSFLLLLLFAACEPKAEKDVNKASAAPESSASMKEAPVAQTLTKAEQTALTPRGVLDQLKAGNDRFMADKEKSRDFRAQRTAAVAGQYPMAVVLACMDSRAAPEIVFDQGVGDIFDIRVAGNIVNEEILGSMEYAVEHGGAKLIAVVGHSACGGVKGACDNVKEGNLTKVVQDILPATKTAMAVEGPKNSTNPAYVAAVSKANVYLSLETIKKRSPILAKAIQEGRVGIVGGMYDLATGKVDFYGDTFVANPPKPVDAAAKMTSEKPLSSKPAH